jgi:hypothetical protein
MVKCKATQKPHVGNMPNDSQTDVPQTGGLFSLAIVSYVNTALPVRSALMQAVNVIVEQQAWKSVSFTLLKCCLISALVTQLPCWYLAYKCMEDFTRAAAPSISLPTSASFTTSRCPSATTFSRWLLRQLASDPLFTTCVLFTDEARFTRNGILNVHNAQTWADENPQQREICATSINFQSTSRQAL